MRAAVYTRISSDPQGRRAGVARQETDCRALVDARGWELAGVYTDNDTSAYAGKVRPEYERLLADIEAGMIEALVAWHPDRLHRSLVELERFITVVEAHGVSIATVQGGEFDLSTASGKMTARIVGTVARHESEHKSERHRAKSLELARDGKPSGGGTRPFGYEADQVTIRPSEAVYVAEAAMAMLSGASVRSLVALWNDRGITTTTGKPWRPANFTRMMKSPRIAGLREHRGEVIGEAVWDGIITPADHHTIVTIFNGNADRQKRAPRKYLLTSGLAVCGLCGADLVARPRGDGARSYVCARGPGFSGCGKIRALADPFEDWTRDAVIEAVSGEGLAAALADVDTDAPALLTEIAGLEESLEQLAADHYADKRIGRREYLAARDAIDTRIEALRREMEGSTSARMVADLPTSPERLRDFYDSHDLAWRRRFIEIVIEQVTVNPAVKGRNTFDASRFNITWHG